MWLHPLDSVQVAAEVKEVAGVLHGPLLTFLAF